MASFKYYVWVLLGGMLVPVLLVLCTNLYLLQQDSKPDRFMHASEWQEKTHGITMATMPGRNEGSFKILRLNDRLPDINAIVFGSSTSFAIQADMFPSGIRIYNFSQPGNPLSAIIGQIEYILDHYENVKWMFVPLDWSVGFLFFVGEPSETDLSRDYVQQAIATNEQRRPWGSAIKTALSYPMVINLYSTLKTILTSNNKIRRFQIAFFPPDEGEEYVCPDGIEKDYDSYARGHCFGFRYDGSLASPPPLSNPRGIMKQILMLRDILAATKGQPQQNYLVRLSEQAHRLKKRGGQMIFFRPPLFPGLEARLLEDNLRHTKAVISRWAEDNNLVVLDFGPSENFGCLASEFADAAHTTSPCYRKLFDATWRKYPELSRLPVATSIEH